MTDARLRYPSAPAALREPGALQWLVLAIITVAQTSYQAGLQSSAPLAPFLQSDLQITRAEIGLFGSAISLGALAMSLPAGWLVDRFGSRPGLVAGTSTVGLSLLVASRLGSFWPMAAAMFTLGLGVGISSNASTKAVVNWFTARTRGTAMGIKQTGTSLGGAIAAAALPAIAIASDWRFALVAAGLLAISSGLLCLAGYHDFVSARAERHSKSSGSLRSVLRSRNVQYCCVAGCCFTVIQMSLTTYLVLYLTEAQHMPVTQAGTLAALAQMVSVGARIGLGVLSDRLLGARRRELLVFAGSGAVAAAVVMAVAGSSLSLLPLTAMIMFFGLVGLGWTGLFVILLAEISDQRTSGMTVAAGFASLNVGYFIGPPLFGLIVDISQSYVFGWLGLAVVAAIGTIAVVKVRERAGAQAADSLAQ